MSHVLRLGRGKPPWMGEEPNYARRVGCDACDKLSHSLYRCHTVSSRLLIGPGEIAPITVMKAACTAGLAATPPVISGTISFPALMNKTIIAALVSGLCGMAHAQDAAELPVVTVFGSSAGPASAVDSAANTTHTDIAWKDYPASIQTVPAEVLKDRGVTRIDQLVETVSGVHAESNYGGNGATFFNIRGFSESNGLRDGFRNYGYYAFRDVQNIDQVDVFKGPAGALYGGI